MSTGIGSVGRALRHPPFAAAAALLIAAAVAASPLLTGPLRLALRKAAVPLVKPLAEFDKTALAGYEFRAAPTMDSAIANGLGATDHVNLQFIDASVLGLRDPARLVNCFITYNTGRPDLVPHIPDNCYLGAGYEIVEAGNVNIEIAGPTAEPEKVPVRAVTFVKSDVLERATPTVVYTFHCNGKFLNTRTQVRAQLGSLFDKGAYFCKIEVSFGGPNSAPRHCTRDQTIQAAEKFLSQLLPVLLRDHLPDWEAVQRGEPTA